MFLNRSLASLLCSVAIVSGQQPEDAPPAELTPPGIPTPTPDSIPLPGGPPSVPPLAATAEAPAQNPEGELPNPLLGDTKITTDINEPKLTGDSLANLYRKYTGRRVIVALAAQKAEFSFVQEASEASPLTFASATKLLLKAAVIEGFVFVPDDLLPGVDVLTLATSGIRPTAIGVKFYSEKDKLPETDAVISYVMTLDHLKPAEAQNIFTQIVGTLGAYGSIVPSPNISALIITENTSLIRKLIDLKAQIDKPSSQIDTVFVNVKFADVTEIAATLTDLLTDQQSTQSTAGTQRIGEIRGNVPGAMPQGGGPQGSEPGSGGGAEAVPIKIIPDPRTNRIFAKGRPRDLIFVKQLINDFDKASNESNRFRRKLHFLSVGDFLPVAGDALSRFFGGSNDGGGGAAPGGAQGGAGQQGGASQGGRSRGGQANRGGGRNSGGSSGSSGANFGGNGGNGGMSGGGGGSSRGGGGSGGSSEGPNISSAPTSLVVGRNQLIADNITNSIIVLGPPSGIEIIERLLDQLDVRPDQVMISTVIGQLGLTDKTDVGLDLLRLGGDFVSRGGGGAGPALPILGTITDAIAASPAVGTPGTPGYVAPALAQKAGSSAFKPGELASGIPGFQVYGNLKNNLNVYLSALQSRGNFTVVSRGSIFTSNNKEGFIKSGQRIAIPTGSNSFGSGGSSTQVDYQDVALELAITPLINSANEITMEISLVNDERGQDQVIAGAGSNGTALTVPGIITREILTTVTVPNNETVVLGGLITSRDNKTKSGIPVLSSIPYLGAMFGRTETRKERDELMVFIQPSVVRNEETLNAVQMDMDSRYKVASKTRGVSEAPGVLPPVGTVNPGTEPAVATTPRASAIKIPANPDGGTVKKKLKLGPAHRR